MRPRDRVRAYLARRDLPTRHDWLADKIAGLACSADEIAERTKHIGAGIALVTGHLTTRFDRLERLIMATFAEVATDLDHLTTAAAEKLEAALASNSELRDAVSRGELEKAQALAAQDAQHASVVSAIADRLRGLGSDAENPVPDTTPLPDAPATEAPVDEVPAGDGVEAGAPEAEQV